jgi:hypothetical protein
MPEAARALGCDVANAQRRYTVIDAAQKLFLTDAKITYYDHQGPEFKVS